MKVMLREHYPCYLLGRPVETAEALPVVNKFDGRMVCRVSCADAGMIDRAIAGAVRAFETTRRLPSFRRQAVLDHVLLRARERREELAHVLALEAGKPIRDARGEVARMIDTFRLASEESTRIGGEFMPLDISARSEGVTSFWRRVPVGPCAFVTPFNFPLNLVAHKIGPAIACGCPFVLKPASRTPVSALILAEILAETEWPAEAFSVLPCAREAADALTTDDRIKLLSFTGSPDAGWTMKSRAGRKRVILELGGNAACIVDEGTDVDRATDRLIVGTFYQSGQSCISVQRILAHASIYEHLRLALGERAARLKMGDPLQEDTFLGPLISEADARRIEAWVGEAVNAGARIVCGGNRHGAFFEPTLLEGVPAVARLCCEEAFGPVAVLAPFSSFEEAVAQVNASRFGLQAGVFTRDLHRAFYAFERLEVGGVVINDVPSLRVDAMPYGGVKDSGLGREGVRFAIRDMTEERLMVLSGLGAADQVD